VHKIFQQNCWDTQLGKLILGRLASDRHGEAEEWQMIEKMGSEPLIRLSSGLSKKWVVSPSSGCVRFLVFRPLAALQDPALAGTEWHLLHDVGENLIGQLFRVFDRDLIAPLIEGIQEAGH
jgi:hypothetical protein